MSEVYVNIFPVFERNLAVQKGFQNKSFFIEKIVDKLSPMVVFQSFMKEAKHHEICFCAIIFLHKLDVTAIWILFRSTGNAFSQALANELSEPWSI